LIGGPQGAGLETSIDLLSRAFARSGHGVLSYREYFSNIKGRHSYLNLRASSRFVPKALKEMVQIIGAMDAETVFTHYEELEKTGYLIWDSSSAKKPISAIPSMTPQLKKRILDRFQEMELDGTVSSLVDHLVSRGSLISVELDFPSILASLTEKFSLIPEQASRYVSSILFGAVAGLAGIDEESLQSSIVNRFGDRRTLVEHNMYLVKQVSDLVKNMHGSPYQLEPSTIAQKEFLAASGNDVIAMGKIVAGLRYQSYYPITPAADESFFIESHESLGGQEDGLGSIVILQTEDELAAINSAIGAALTGVRSATATSGPGFSLMVEGLGWAGMNEVPLVVTYYQRSGPSTGQATRGSQEDLLSALFASHGEFTKFLIASGDHEEAFYDSVEAFNLAEKYNVPVIHLVDKFLANSVASMPIPDFSKIRIERGATIEHPGVDYRRFDLGNTVSERAALGSGAVIEYNGVEHDEYGQTTEDPVNRIMMYEKRMKKLELADLEIPPESRATLYGPEEADFLLVGWGYAKMVALEALNQLRKEGYLGCYLHLRMFSPFPTEYVKSILNRFSASRIIALEHNYLAQASMITSMHTLMHIDRSIVKYTGRPMYVREVEEAVKKILKDGLTKVVLSHGA